VLEFGKVETFEQFVCAGMRMGLNLREAL